jgi:hypothetical protein
VRCGRGIAEWRDRDISPFVGDLAHVELGCGGTLRWAADGSLTTTEAGWCNLRCTVEGPWPEDPVEWPDVHLVVLRISTGLTFVEMTDGEAAPPVGSEVVLKNAALGVYPYNL